MFKKTKRITQKISTNVILFITILFCTTHAYPQSTELYNNDTLNDNAHHELQQEINPFQNTLSFKLNFTTPKPNDPHEFHFLSTENPSSSRSVGNTSDGYIVNAKPLPQPSTTYKILPTQYQRSLVYGTDEMIQILTDTARKLNKKDPKAVMLIGNIGQNGGGDIPYSVSHNSGRDADIAFFYKPTDKIKPCPQDLIKFGKSLHAKNNDPNIVFDVPKNAALVKTLISHPKVKVQFLFIANHLRNAIFKYMQDHNEDPEILDKLSQMMFQPRSPHDDHLHLRIYCSDEDICAGCIDRSIIHPWIRDPLIVKENCISKYQKLLRSSKAKTNDKITAIHRLALLEALNNEPKLLTNALNNDDIDLKIAALKHIHHLDNASKLLEKNFDTLQNPLLICHTIDALNNTNTTKTHELLLQLLQNEPQPCNNTKENLNSQQQIIQALQNTDNPNAVEPLIQLLQNKPEYTDSINKTLCFLTNHTHHSPHEWLSWYENNKNKDRNTWLIAGFNKHGAKIKKLDHTAIKALLDNIVAPEHISYNAQKMLMKISKSYPNSLKWSQFDARWHWTAYFKKRSKKYKLDLSDRNDKGCKI